MGRLVTVIIPTYNSEKYIRECLESVFSQGYKNIEVIVVDDGSTDDTGQIVKDYHSCRYYKKENGGPASARNFGIQMAKGECIAFLDADDVWFNGKLAAQVAEIEKEGHSGLVYSFSGNFMDDPSEVHDNDDFPCNVSHEGNVFKKLYWHNFIRTSTVLVKKECFDRCGIFNEEADFFAVEDYDMWLRIAKEYKVACVPEVMVGYRSHREGISKHIDRSYKNEKNILLAASARWPFLQQETGSTFKKRLSKLYFDWGADYLEIYEMQKSRQLLWRSVCNDFTNLKRILYLIKSIIPPGILKKTRKIKRES